MNTAVKITLCIVGIIFTVVAGFFLFIHIAFDGIFTGPYYDKSDLISNFEERKSELFEAENYFNSIVPDSAYVKIEFENGKLGIFHVRLNGKYNSNWGLDLNSNKADSLFSELEWSKEDVANLKTKLDAANSVSAESGEYTTIGWQRSGMGMFFYKIFNEPLSDSLINEYNDGCMYIFYKENIVLEYGGGAIGPQCFPSFYQKNETQTDG
jgi:hypothetical protein